MTTPTITTTGTTLGLLLITDHNGSVHRVPKTALCGVADSSNDNVFRVDVCTAHGALYLVFSSAAEVTAFIAAIDAEY